MRSEGGWAGVFPRFIDADAITLDLEDGVVQTRKAEARGLVKEAIALAGKGGAEVFARVNAVLLHADLDASVWPGVRGIMLPRVASAAEVAEAVEQMLALERRRGLAAGALEVIVLLESARGVWDIRAIITASPRITQVGLDESDLACDLGITPLPSTIATSMLEAGWSSRPRPPGGNASASPTRGVSTRAACRRRRFTG